MNNLPEDKNLNAWGRFALWVSSHQTFVRLAVLSVGLVVFLLFLPAAIRKFLWNGLLAHKILAGMLLVFSLLAVSLVWSNGQRLDVWIFLLFNLRGQRPVWLDKIMVAFTQLGSGIAAFVIGLFLYLAGYHLISYNFFLGSLTLWLIVELIQIYHPTITTFYQTVTDSNCGLPGYWTVIPKWSYQPDFFPGNPDGPVLSFRNLVRHSACIVFPFLWVLHGCTWEPIIRGIYWQGQYWGVSGGCYPVWHMGLFSHHKSSKVVVHLIQSPG